MTEKMNKRENIYSLKGFSKVFRFTTAQTMKNKTYRATFIIFVLVMTCMGPIQYASSRAGMDAVESTIDDGVDKVDIDNLYIVNNTDIGLAMEDLNELYGDDTTSDKNAEAPADDEEYNADTLGIDKKNIAILNADEDVESILGKLGKCDGAVIITADDKGYHIKGIIADDSKIETDEIEAVTETVRGAYDIKRFESTDISEGDVSMILGGVSTDGTIDEKEFLNEENREISEDRFFMYMAGFGVLMFIVISMSTSFIIGSVTEEKQSKLVESLLVSVRPMALLLGKVCGMMTYVVLVLACGVIGSKVSQTVMKAMFDINDEEVLSTGFDLSMFTDFGGFETLLLLFSIVLGFLTFGILSGLFGSSCNKTEDIQNATGSVMIFSMLGYFSSFFVAGTDNDVISLVAGILPPFSFFTAPVAYISDRISLPILALSYLIQITVLILLLRLSAKVYRNLLFSDSSTPKFRTILKSAKE